MIMNRGDEPEQQVAEYSSSVSATAGDSGVPVNGEEGVEPSTFFGVVISSDGAAVIDGEPVPVMPGESLDVAILDTLHGYARTRDAPVQAAISDPKDGYVAIVEVAPDGSSRLVEQHHQKEPSGPVEPHALTEQVPPAAAFEAEDRNLDDGANAPSYQAGSQSTTALAPPAALSRSASGPKRTLSQSDDEYEAPGLLGRPLTVGAVAIAVTAIVIGSLVAVGSGGSGVGGDENQAAGTEALPDKRPMDLKPAPIVPSTPGTLPSSESASPSASATPSTSASPKPKPKPEPKPKPKLNTNPKSEREFKPKPEPAARPKQRKNPGIPTGAVLIKNKNFGFCLDVPGEGKGRPDGKVLDSKCKASGDNQHWSLELRARGAGTRGADLYLIRNTKDNLCLDLPYYGPAPATTPVTEYHCDGTDKDNQLWWFQKRPNGTYWIRNQKSGDQCLDVARKDRSTPQANITLYGCSDLDDHQWSFLKK
ncbi:RICIN domain-containing protein [Streptomyces sp. CoH17]|uniref:RICIN domain-containing protein n=1 Tax=Streptomyces sp. CoH17 TaxID=2992806 RepID=UPI00226EFBC2|nr:RICIN domain-containing protein [Streptomyces sp. CoH17]